MDPVRKAVWFVESHSREAPTLEEIAEACKVSAFHLTRAFAAATGLSLMRYVRARRLSDAARRLAGGAGNILEVALDAGYGSHEAFTRAFREHFGRTPEQVRAQGITNDLTLQEAIPMTTTPLPEIAPPRIETRPAMLVAGLVGRYDCRSPLGIPDQWQRFGQHLGNLAGQVGRTAYGVCWNFDSEGNFDYMSGVEVNDTSALPGDFRTLEIPEQKYAIFTHRGHIAGIRGTMSAIWNRWLPESGQQAAEAPTIERYGPEFDPTTGLGGFEVWLALR